MSNQLRNFKTGDLAYLRVRIVGVAEAPNGGYGVQVSIVNRLGAADDEAIHYVAENQLINPKEASRATT